MIGYVLMLILSQTTIIFSYDFPADIWVAMFMVYVFHESTSVLVIALDSGFSGLAPVVKRMDNAIHRINHYQVDSAVNLWKLKV